MPGLHRCRVSIDAGSPSMPEERSRSSGCSGWFAGGGSRVRRVSSQRRRCFGVVGRHSMRRAAGGVVGRRSMRAGAVCSFAIVNQVLVRVWARRGMATDRMGSPRGDRPVPRSGSEACCVLSDADPTRSFDGLGLSGPACMGRPRRGPSSEFDGVPVVWLSPVHGGFRPAMVGSISSARRAFGGCLGTRRR